MRQPITIRLQIPAQRLRRILAWHHWHDLERHKIGPASYPPLQQRGVVRLHQLETPAEVGCHPAAHELQSIRHHTSLFAQAAVDRLSVLIAESFDDHEHHSWRSSNPRETTHYHTERSRLACPLWVKSRHVQCKRACPLYPRKRPK